MSMNKKMREIDTKMQLKLEKILSWGYGCEAEALVGQLYKRHDQRGRL